MRARAPNDPTERDFQSQVVQLARMFGFRVAHFRPAQTTKGWRTPMTGDVGFPDLTLTKPGRLVFLELKVPPRKATPEQEAWIADLDSVPGVNARVVYPRDFDDIAALLR